MKRPKITACPIMAIEMMMNDIDGKLNIGQTEMSASELIAFLKKYSEYPHFTKANRKQIKDLLRMKAVKNHLKQILWKEINRRLKSKRYK